MLMIKSAVTISLVPEARGGPFVFWDDLAGSMRKAKDLGFDGVEIFPPGPDALKVSEVRSLLDLHGLGLAAVGTGAGWVKHKLRLTDGDAAVRARARAFVKGIIDFAGPLGAPAIIGSMQGRHGDGVERDTAIGYLLEALQELGSHARQYGVPLIYEPINRYETNICTSIVDGAALLRRLGEANVLLLADLFHMNIEETGLPDAVRAAKGYIGHVHFVDSNRRPAGLGHLDYAPVAAALREIGYDRYLSAEALPYPNSDAAAEQTIKAFRAYFR